MLTGSLALGVPLAPLIAVWVAITNPIPQVGGFLGGARLRRCSASPRARVVGVIACLVIFLVYQQLENHVLQPLIIGRAVRLSPPATMVAALVGVSAGGLVGGLFAIPLLGATKAIYLSTRIHERDARRGTGAPELATRGARRSRGARRVTRVEHRVGVEVEPARHEEIREPFEHRHQRGDRRVVARRARLAHPRDRARSRCR